jgi:cytoskeletal protein CcmA (bactofilin family)
MAIFNNQQTATKPAPSFAPEPTPAPAKDTPVNVNTDFASAQPPVAPRAAASSAKESLIAADLTIEGKIEGAGHVRIAGRFKGDVNVQGDLTIENGAKLNGGVRANRVNVAGELEGNIESAKHVELVDSGAVNGDIKAETLTVAAGSRIRGRVECGAWGDAKGASKSNGRSPDSEAA